MRRSIPEDISQMKQPEQLIHKLYTYTLLNPNSVSPQLNLSEADLKSQAVIIPTPLTQHMYGERKVSVERNNVFTGYGLNMLHLQELQT